MKQKIKDLNAAARKRLGELIDQAQATFTPTRIVKALAPVFSGAAGAIVTWLADHFPGLPTMPKEWLAAIFGTVTLAVLGIIYKQIDRVEERDHLVDESAKQRASEERIAAIAAAPSAASEPAAEAAAEKVAADVKSERADGGDAGDAAATGGGTVGHF